MLRIEAFGALTVVRDDRRVVVAPPEAPEPRVVLTLLACHGAAGISRDRIAALLGRTDAGSDDAWWHSLVGVLRDWLGDRYLAVRDDHLALRPSCATTDVLEFAEAMASGALERAVQLHQARLVEGLHHRDAPAFERWLQLQRETFASDAASAMERLAEEASRRGEPLTAVRWWRQLAREYPLNHRIAASLMEALVQAGDREGALRHARFLEALADERLALPGDEQVLAMARALRNDAGRSVGAAGGDDAPGAGAPPDVGPPDDGLQVTDTIARFRRAVAGRFRVDGEVGRGGHGCVLRATDLRHQRDVAIKLLHPELAAPLGTRFAREIRVVAALQHPHVLPLYDSGEAAGTLYFVMPLVTGPSLREHLRHEGPLALDEALVIARQVASALGEAHRRGIVHRDIKPENILLAGRAALVADFGIACVANGQSETGLTAPGLVVGTPAYMSPEQASPEETVDGRADLYSLGCVLYEMLTGTPPFGQEGGQALLARHATAPIPPLHTTRAELPASVDALLARALAKRPEERFATAEDFENALAVLGRSTDASAAAPAGPGMRPARHHWPPSVRAAALAVALAVLLAAFVLPLARLPSRSTARVPTRHAASPPRPPVAGGPPAAGRAPPSTPDTTEMRP